MVEVPLVTITCWCGTPFALPQEMHDYARRNSTQKIYCPHGHSIAYTDGEDVRQRRRAERAEQQLARVEQERAEAERQRDLAIKREGRLKKRAAAGACPCCHRSFANMAQHMKREHPQFVEAQGAKVVPIKKGVA